jgi:hypothetical protein
MKLYNMSEGSEYPSTNEVPLSPRPDTVTVAEYERAVDRLRQFSQADISGVVDLNGTAELTDRFRVGLSLRAIAITHGKSEQGADIYDTNDRLATTKMAVRLPNYSIVQYVGNMRKILVLSADPNLFSARSPEQILISPNDRRDVEYCSFNAMDMSDPATILKLGYYVNIPATISLGEASDLPPTTIMAFERHSQQSKLNLPFKQPKKIDTGFAPFLHPQDAKEQQGYLGYLQRAAKDILSLSLPLSTSVPAAFSSV